MNRLIWLWLLSLPVCAITKPRLVSKPKNTQHLCLNSIKNQNFGKTHFIEGHKAQSTISIPELKTPLVNEKEFIINGSSAHLIDHARQAQSFFTTVHNIPSIILELINQAQESINVEAFSLTDMRIAEALIAAHKRGVQVSVILDEGRMKERHSKSQKLINNGICVMCYDCSLRPDYKKKDWSEPLMHHKCMQFDDKWVITGSANLTKAAGSDNMETITLLKDPLVIEEHRQEFERLRKWCKECLKQQNAKE
jgi:phospholipase D